MGISTNNWWKLENIQITQYKWVNYLDESNKETYEKIDGVCSAHWFDTLVFIFELRKNKDLKNIFVEKNDVSIEDIDELLDDVFFPIAEPIVKDMEEIKNMTQWLLNKRTNGELKNKIAELLNVDSINKYEFTINEILDQLGCDLEVFYQSLENCNYDAKQIWHLKNSFLHSAPYNLKHNLQNSWHEFYKHLIIETKKYKSKRKK